MALDLGIEEDSPEPLPKPRAAKPAAAPAHGTNGHAPPDDELYLVSAVLTDPAHWPRASFLPVEAFTNPEARALWGCLAQGYRWPDDLRKFQKRTGLTAARLFDIQHLSGIGLGFQGWLEHTVEAHRERQFRALVSEMSSTVNPDPKLWGERLAALAGSGPRAPAVAKGLFSHRIPEDNDESVLLGQRYLNRGDTLVLSGNAGAGKSSMARQMQSCWALGRDFHGIKPARPLRSLEIQAEDSEGDIGEVAESIADGLRLTEEERAVVNGRVECVTERVRRGRDFFEEVRRLAGIHKPDLVWINPLQAFLQGDVTDSRDLGDFLRAGLNGINEPATFAYVIVHHTTKPATGKDRSERLWHEVMYDMAGGAEIINFARAIISLRPGANPGEFNLVLAKRGTRAGVTRPAGTAGQFEEIVTTIPVKWSDQSIELTGRQRRLKALFWVSRAPDPAKEPTGKHAGGRPRGHAFETYRPAFPTKAEKALTTNELFRAFKSFGEIGKSSFFALLNEAVEEGRVVRVIPQDGQPRYHLPT